MKILNTKNLGTLMMVSAVALLAFIYLPIIQTYFFPQPAKIYAASETNYWIEIPKINASSPIELNIDPWNEGVYKAALKKGVAHAKGTPLPGKKGAYIFAHSSDYPWNITRYNTAFFKLNELVPGDTIVIHSSQKTYRYRVTGTKEIWPNETQYLTEHKADLTLQTCTPIGTDFKRLLVFAKKK